MPIDPCFDALLADPRNTVRPPPAHVPMDKVRRTADAAMAQGAVPQLHSVEDRLVRVNSHDVPVRHYRPTEHTILPLILFCHGGGFVWGSIDTHDGICRRLAVQTGAAVISVGYRLSPETRFPGAVEDAWSVLRAVVSDADGHGIAPNSIALCGDSAGGGICVSTAALAVRAGLQLRHLALIYPALDPGCDSPSMRELAEGPLLTRDAMCWFWACYLGESLPDPALMAMHSPYVTGFPPTTIATAEHDPLRDEGEAFARRLADSGVEAQLTRYPGMIHGFLSLPASSPIIEGAMRDISGRLQQSLTGGVKER